MSIYGSSDGVDDAKMGANESQPRPGIGMMCDESVCMCTVVMVVPCPHDMHYCGCHNSFYESSVHTMCVFVTHVMWLSCMHDWYMWYVMLFMVSLCPLMSASHD